MTIITVLVVYASVVATLALAISLLLLRSLPTGPSAPAVGHALALPDSGPDIGSPAPPFTARTSTAALFDTAELAGQTHLLGFLSSSCQGCLLALPAMIGYASQLPDPRQLITVIVGDVNARAAEIEQRLARLAVIVSEPEGGPIATAYRITSFPSFVLVSEAGTVLGAGNSVFDLPLPQRQ
ncbi:MAG TPA: hypothetical protein VGB75_00660 [Jatrophihabitans sp.]|jgi:thiol-disulfide isomerase/thioredoxin|uniref:TlpA family protein disulfide reductase n=1 Tax=Jatrophihabitans sp. TaxID=1932789 RepID=UPI002F15057A